MFRVLRTCAPSSTLAQTAGVARKADAGLLRKIGVKAQAISGKPAWDM
jgi:hypothetical protein